MGPWRIGKLLGNVFLVWGVKRQNFSADFSRGTLTGVFSSLIGQANAVKAPHVGFCRLQSSTWEV
jgi:hypothetical protein